MAVWILNVEGREWETNEEIQKCGSVLNGVIHRAREQGVQFINDTVPTLTGAGGESDTELKRGKESRQDREQVSHPKTIQMIATSGQGSPQASSLLPHILLLLQALLSI